MTSGSGQLVFGNATAKTDGLVDAVVFRILCAVRRYGHFKSKNSVDPFARTVVTAGALAIALQNPKAAWPSRAANCARLGRAFGYGFFRYVTLEYRSRNRAEDRGHAHAWAPVFCSHESIVVHSHIARACSSVG